MVLSSILTGRHWAVRNYSVCMGFRWQNNNFFQNWILRNLWIATLKILSRRLYSPSLKTVGWIEDTQLIFLIFYAFISILFPAPPLLPCQIYRQMHGKFGKIRKINWARSSQATSFKLGEYNIPLSILTLRFKNCVLFAIGFSYRHCNFWPLSLPVKMAPKTVKLSLHVSLSNSTFGWL